MASVQCGQLERRKLLSRYLRRYFRWSRVLSHQQLVLESANSLLFCFLATKFASQGRLPEWLAVQRPVLGNVGRIFRQLSHKLPPQVGQALRSTEPGFSTNMFVYRHPSPSSESRRCQALRQRLAERRSVRCMVLFDEKRPTYFQCSPV